ncbi:hypothetical protein ACHAW6_003983 [Cyclotella cf. meneghiniana]
MPMLHPRSQHMPITTVHLTTTGCHLCQLAAQHSSMSNPVADAPGVNTPLMVGTLVHPLTTTKHIASS